MSWNRDPPASPPDPTQPRCQCGAKRLDDCLCPRCPECGELNGGQYGDLCEDCEREREETCNTQRPS